MKIVTVGDNCMDVYNGINKFYPGGNPVNVAVYMAKLGVEAAYVGVVGNDAYGEIMIDSIKSRNVDVSMLHVAEGKTAVTEVELVNHDRVFGNYYEGVLENFRLTNEDISFIQTYPMIHSGIWGKIENDLQILKNSGMIVSFDFSDKLEYDIVRKTLPFVHYAFFSYTRRDSFIEDYLKNAVKLGAKVAVTTLGENGSLAFDGVNFYEKGVLPVEVVDTMGAGDSYIAGFLSGVLQKKDLDECMVLGTKTAANNITYFGAW